jgi:hypothetical protein
MTSGTKTCAWWLVGIGSCLLLGSVGAQVSSTPKVAATMSDPYRQTSFAEAYSTPVFGHWRAHHLVTYGGQQRTSGKEPAVTAYDQSGTMTHQAYPWFEGAKTVSVSDASMNNSGRLVVSGGTTSQDGVIANFIGRIGKDGHFDQVVRTSPFLPVYICPADDGTVWAYGVDRDKQLKAVPGSSLLRQFSLEKGQLRTVDTSGLAPGWSQLLQGPHPASVTLNCNSKTVILHNDKVHQLAEYDVGSGSLRIVEVMPLPGDPYITGVALTSSGDLFASYQFFEHVPQAAGLFKFTAEDNSSGRWMVVGGTFGAIEVGSAVSQIIGADRDDVVYLRNVRGDDVFWSKQAPPPK